MTTTEIVPSLKFDSPLETALATNDRYQARLAPLKAEAQQLCSVPKMDADQYAKIGAVLSEVRSIRKNEIAPLWAPFDGVVARIRDFLRTKRQQAENLCEEIDAMCRAKMKEYERDERAATAKEQKKHPEGTVQQNVPAVSGYRRSVTYPITIEDSKALIRAFLKAYKAGDTKRVQFLSQFVCLDEKALREHARSLKNPKQFMEQVPGILCKEE